jgi:hypothetical protein
MVSYKMTYAFLRSIEFWYQGEYLTVKADYPLNTQISPKQKYSCEIGKKMKCSMWQVRVIRSMLFDWEIYEGCLEGIGTSDHGFNDIHRQNQMIGSVMTQ